MKPIYWLGIMAVIGLIFGYFIFHSTLIGVTLGIMVGAIIYRYEETRKQG